MIHHVRDLACGRFSLAAVLGCAVAGAQPLPPPPPDRATQPALSQGITVEVKEFVFEGNTVISSERLRQEAEDKLAEFGTRTVTSEQLEAIRKALTDLYTGATDDPNDPPRYVNSGAVLPDQDAGSGVIRFQIVEGSLTQINVAPVEIEGQAAKLHLRRSYVVDRIAIDPTRPLDLKELQERLELLRVDPNIARLNAELRPGEAPGQSMLDVMIAESQRYYAALSFNNYRSVSSGAEELEALFSARNLTGYGDLLNIRYGITQGGFDDMHLSCFDDISLDYTIPITAQDTTLTFAIQRSSDAVVEDPFAELDIDSDSLSVGLTLRHPLYRTPSSELAVFLTVEYRENETRLLGDRFSFSIGAEDGESRVFPIRIGQEFSYASPAGTWAFAARSTFTIGTDWFTGNEGQRPRDSQGNLLLDNDGEALPFADAQFFAWLGQMQYVHKLGDWKLGSNQISNTRLVLRGAAQFACDNLLSIEQFSLGGVSTVRGYRENRVVRDNAITGTAELRVPVIQRAGRSVLEFVPFLDGGFGFNHETRIEGSEFISSIGAGIVFTPNEYFSAEIYYGYPFQKFENLDDLSDIGIHFNIVAGARW